MIEEVFYLLNLVLLYGIIIPLIGSNIKEKCFAERRCRSYLKKTWLGYSVDMADGQWKDVRNSLWMLWILIIFASGYHLVFKVFTKNLKWSTSYPSSAFRLLVGIGFVLVQHGKHSIIIFSISLFGYFLSKLLKNTKFAFFVIWIYGLSILAFKESYRLQHFYVFSFLQPLFNQNLYGGLYRWQFPVNFLVLRIISFCLDHHWAQCVADGRDGATAGTTHRPLHEYNLMNFLSYVLYVPLYIAGPVLCFDDYMGQQCSEQQRHCARSTAELVADLTLAKDKSCLYYGLRWLGSFLLMELLTSRLPLFALVRAGLFPQLSAAELCVACYMLLKIMWLKFLLIWRLFRLWALADGIDPPENMKRCMSNNCSIVGFWKGWHSSFNLWLVRYLYLPLGGRDRRLLLAWPIFVFVALWHDAHPRLLLWGLLNSLFFVAETAGAWVLASGLPQRIGVSGLVLRVVCVLTSTVHIFVLISVNLLGYAMGAGTLLQVLTRLLSLDGLVAVGASFYFLCVGVNIMDYIKRMRSGTAKHD